MKIYVMVTDDVLKFDRIQNELLIVGRQSDAERLVECGAAAFYEKIDVLDSKDVDDIYLKFLGEG